MYPTAVRNYLALEANPVAQDRFLQCLDLILANNMRRSQYDFVERILPEVIEVVGDLTGDFNFEHIVT